MSFGRDALQRLARLVSAGLRLVINLHARRGRRALHHRLVFVVADLHEGHVPRQDALLGGLALDVQALAHGPAAQHLRDGSLAARPVHREPLRGAVRLGVRREAVLGERARGPAAVAVGVEVGDELPRIGEVLLCLQVRHATEEALELRPREHQHLALLHSPDGGRPRGILDQRLLAEQLPAVVMEALLLVLPLGLERDGLAVLQDEELLAALVALPDDVVALLVRPHLHNVRELGDLLVLHHLQELGAPEVILAAVPLRNLQADAEVDKVIPAQLATDALLAARPERVRSRRAEQDLRLVDDRAGLAHSHQAVLVAQALDRALEHDEQAVAGLAALAEELARETLVDLHGLHEADQLGLLELGERPALLQRVEEVFLPMGELIPKGHLVIISFVVLLGADGALARAVDGLRLLRQLIVAAVAIPNATRPLRRAAGRGRAWPNRLHVI
mmetsp:Transcript_76795/g.235025  ORF Transcript_76795/g.235025 Transcript_76795/m.235025 type:complete len:448 (+) Transcript_76795:1292-2635(+)